MAPKATENVKLPTELVNKVRARKKKTGVAIGIFIARAVEKELKIKTKEPWIN